MQVSASWMEGTPAPHAAGPVETLASCRPLGPPGPAQASRSHFRPSLGIPMLNLTKRSPRWVGSPLNGIPSPRTRSTAPGRVTARTASSTRRPSRCSRLCSKPSRASSRLTSMSTCRSTPARRKVLCSAMRSVRTRSPGIFFGCCSPLPLKVMVSPEAMPRSTPTGNSSLWSRHFCFDGTSTCCCITMGPIWTLRSSISFAHCTLHFLHRSVKRSAQPRHITFLWICLFVSSPLYRASRLTVTSPVIDGPFSTCWLFAW
mmetsp:Transcript_26563/g.76525  ORF Transcript_26563/g.76525 Transcript_26563/m.76525 type:complete len:259 (+) Transcript_26563:114-890(+)